MIVFRLLGPVGLAHEAGDSVLSRLGRSRALLAALLHHPNQYVAHDRLAECVWDTPPASAHTNLRAHIMALRRALDLYACPLGSRLAARRGSRGEQGRYRLNTKPNEVDATVFAALAESGRRHLTRREPEPAAETLQTALDLWHGNAGDDLPDTPCQQGWAAELNERRLTATDDLAEARLQLGDHTGLVAQLRRQLCANPHRERTADLLMRALHATGDRAAAIALYHEFRSQFVDHYGVEPATGLNQTYVAVLDDTTPALTCSKW